MQRLVPPNVSAIAEPKGRLPIAFGRRFFLLLGIGVVWILPAWGQPRYLYALLGWDLFVLVVWAIDLARLPRPAQLEVRRVWDEPLALAHRMHVTLQVRNGSGMPLVAQIHDQAPDTFSRDLPGGRLLAPAGATGSISYPIAPSARGDAAFGDVWLRYRSGWAVAEHWARARLGQSVRVYPDLYAAQKMRLYMIRSRQIELEKRLRRQRGQGREFESLREFRSGDEFRDISWSATARRGKLITKLHQIERSQTLWLVVDAGRLLRARVNGLTKLDYSVNAALSLAQMALYAGDRVGLLAYGRQPQQRVAPGRGILHMRLLIEALAQVRAESFEADHLRAVELLLSSQNRRSFIIWITDLAETPATPEVIECTAAMTPRHLVLLGIAAQTELRALVAASPETPQEMYRYSAALEIVERRDLLMRKLRQGGVMAIEAKPSTLSTALVNQYLEVKERSLL